MNQKRGKGCRGFHGGVAWVTWERLGGGGEFGRWAKTDLLRLEGRRRGIGRWEKIGLLRQEGCGRWMGGREKIKLPRNSTNKLS